MLDESFGLMTENIGEVEKDSPGYQSLVYLLFVSCDIGLFYAPVLVHCMLNHLKHDFIVNYTRSLQLKCGTANYEIFRFRVCCRTIAFLNLYQKLDYM